jgi:hypothetical protein
MADGGSPQTKRCASCGGTYRLAFFARRRNSEGNRSLKPEAQRRRDRCIGCEAATKQEDSIDRRLRRKAIRTRREHGIDLKNQGVIENQDDLGEFYGWSLDRMIDDIKRAMEKECPYCDSPVNVVELGLGNITLDILYPNKRPNYSTNVQWCCTRCNSEKQRTPPDEWGDRHSMWDLWRRNQVRLQENPEAFGFLAYDSSSEPPLPF